MTAQWEQALEQMSEAKISYEGFMEQLEIRLHQLIGSALAARLPAFKISSTKGEIFSKKVFRKKKKTTES
jgi:DNA topoisomerase IA